MLFNWNLLGDGQHTARLLIDGEEAARQTFTVTTLGLGPFARGLSGAYALPAFPAAGQSVEVRWVEGLQNFVIDGR